MDPTTKDLDLLSANLSSVEITVAKRETSLTDEQRAVVEASVPEKTALKCIAFAGTGKTSTFVGLANSRPDKRILYLAFNKSVETEAKQRFPSNTTTKTTHALAYATIGKKYREIVGNVQAWVVAKTFHLDIYTATIVVRSLENWLNSAEDNPGVEHVLPDVLNRLRPGYEEGVLRTIETLWHNMVLGNGDFKMTHSGYLKLYQLSKPQLFYDIVLLDEAQDTNPVTLSLVLDQRRCGSAIYLAGDPYQQIYAWRGAMDSLDRVEGQTFYLTQSFRFGPEIARVANAVLGSFFTFPKKLQGFDKIESSILSSPVSSGTYIARTNATLFNRAVQLAHSQIKFYPVGTEAFSQLLASLLDIVCVYRRRNMEMIRDRRIARFKDFESLKDYAKSTLDNDLLVKCSIVEKYKDSLAGHIIKVRDYITSSTNEAEQILVTTHKAKGLEWNTVSLAEDFEDFFNERGEKKIAIPTGRSVDEDTQVSSEEVNLLYVALTRAKNHLVPNSTLTKLIKNYEQRTS